MKAAAALVVASYISACVDAPGAAIVQPIVADTCAVARPAFGVAAASERDLFAYDVDAPLNLTGVVRDTVSGVEISDISFDSPGGGRATGLLFDPVSRAGVRPGIVLMHGMPGSAASLTSYGTGLGTDGAVVIAIDAPFARRGGPPLRFTADDRAEQIQLIKDLQRAVDVLRAHPHVDDERVAYHGVSYGGAMGALFVGIERRLEAAVLVVGDGGLVSHVTGPEDSVLGSLPCAVRNAWLREMTPIEPIRFIPHASPTPLLLQNGRLDTLVPMADGQALQSAAPEPKTLLWYDAGHGLNQQALLDRLSWLHQQIGLDPPQ